MPKIDIGELHFVIRVYTTKEPFEFYASSMADATLLARTLWDVGQLGGPLIYKVHVMRRSGDSTRICITV